MNDNAHDRLINGTGHLNCYIGYRLQRCTWEYLVEKFKFTFDDNWEMELECHHCELYNTMESLMEMNNEKRIEFEFYSIEHCEAGLLVKERTLLEEEQKHFVLTKKYPVLPIKRYEVTGFTDFKPSIFKNVSKGFKYDFVMEIKGEYAHILYNSEEDKFYLLKNNHVDQIQREQVDVPMEHHDMFFWSKFDVLLEEHIVSSLQGNTPSCLRIIADICDEYQNSVLKPDCFGLDRLLQFDQRDCWSEFCFEDSVQVVTSNVLRRFI